MNQYLLVAVLATLAVLPIAAANAQIATTTTTGVTTTHAHHLFFRHGYANPFLARHIVTVPALTIANNVLNTCPATTPVLLSNGQCVTSDQALALIQSGQLQVGGSITGYNGQILGHSILGVRGFTSPFSFFSHHLHR